MMSVKKGRKANPLVQYTEYRKQGDEWEVLVIPMMVSNLVLGLPWRETRKSTGTKVDWQPDKRQMDRNEQRFKKWTTQVLCQKAVRDTMIMSLAATINHLWASAEVAEVFAICPGEWQEFLGASLEGITKSEINPRMVNGQAGAAAVVAAEEWHSDGAWMTATRSLWHEGRNWTTGVVYCEEPSDPTNLGALATSTLPKHATMQTRQTRTGTDRDNMGMVTTDDGGRIPAQFQDFTLLWFVVSTWDTRTMWIYAANICQHSHSTFDGIQWDIERNSDSGSKSDGRGWEGMTDYQAVEKHTNCVDLRSPRNSEWEQELGKIETSSWKLSRPTSKQT